MVSSSVSEFLSKYFLCNYFLLMTVDVLLVWCGLAAIAKFELIILLSAIIISLNKLRNQTTRMDLFIIFFSISIAIASLSNIWGIQRSGFFNGRGKWAKGFENQRV